MAKSVSIIGCGWLGKALAKALLNENYTVVVTTQSKGKIAGLSAMGVNPELLSLPVESPESIVSSVFNQTTLIIAITPQIRQGRVDYAKKIEQLVTMAELGKVKRIILLSSSAVYNGLTGTVSENSKLDLSNEKVSIISAAENAVRKFSNNVVVLRLAGLLGADRHPGKFLQGKKILSGPQAYINLIHQTDVVGLLMNLLKNPTITGTYNAVSATETSKQHFYQAAAKAKKLPVPEFAFETAMLFGKRVDDTKLRSTLDYQYIYDDLVVWLYKGDIS
jgi:nucleoside-diphosphate-sugar epimerase